MNEQQEKRREWVVGRRGSYTTGWPIYEDGALVNWLGSTPREATAHQIVDDHNRIPLLEAELERTRAAFGALVRAAYRVTETVENGQPPDSKARWVCCGEYWDKPHNPDCRHLALERAIAQAKAVLSTTAQQEEEGHA